MPPSLESRRDQMFPKLAPAEINRLRRFGTVRTWQPGELLFEPGRTGPGMFVLLRGHILTTRKNGLGIEMPIIKSGPGHFTGEVGQLSGRPPLAYARALDVVEALVIDPPSLRAVVVAEAELGERIMRALILRRMGLIETGGGGPLLIGPPGGAGMVRLQGFLSRNGHPHLVLDPALDSVAEDVMKLHQPRPNELPLVVCPDGTVLKCPTERELARRLGLYIDLSADRVYDVAIVGAGPAGLACCGICRIGRAFRTWCSTPMHSAVRRARARESKITSVSRPVSQVRRSPGALMFRRRNSVPKWWCPWK